MLRKGRNGSLCLKKENDKCVYYDRAVFNRVCKINRVKHWFCFMTLCDWIKNLAPLSRPIRSETKTNRDLIARVFALSSDWLIVLFVSAVIGQSIYFGLDL